MQRENICPDCGSRNNLTARYCGRCGAQLSECIAARGANDPPVLYLQEELLLFALDDEEGKVASSAAQSCSLALAAGLLTELVLAQRLEIEEGKKKLVGVCDTKPIGEPVLDEVLSLIASSARRRKLTDWVAKTARIKGLRDRIARGLCTRGILEDRETQYGFLFFRFTRQRFPTLDPAPEYEAIDRVRAAIFDAHFRVDTRTALLVSLADTANLLAIRFGKQALRAQKARIKQIGEHHAVSQALRESIQAMQAAMVAAITAGAVVSAVSG